MPDNQPELELPPARRPKVVALADEEWRRVRRAALAACPTPECRLLQVIYFETPAGRTGLLTASRDTLADKARISVATFKRQRAALVAAGYLIPDGGGHRKAGVAGTQRRGEAARYLVPAVAEPPAGDLRRCPYCGDVDPDHRPRDCPRRPIAPRLGGLE
jgi:hypothetical protein